MVDDGGADAALGLGAFARVINDEGIELRQGTRDGPREAGRRKSQRFPRQPFEIAMLAGMDHRMRAEGGAQPAIESQIAVRRRQGRIVIARLRIDIVAARRLDADGDMTEAMDRQTEAVSLSVEERIGLGRAPAHRHFLRDGGRQAGEKRPIVGQGQDLALVALPGVRGAAAQDVDQRLARDRRVADIISGRAHRFQHGGGAGGRVEPDAIAQAPIAIGIVRQDQRHLALFWGRTAQARPMGGEIGGEGDVFRIGRMADQRTFGAGIEARLLLEGDGAGKQAAVDLGQGDIHRQVARRQAPAALDPGFAGGGGEDELQHRCVGAGQRPAAIARARRRGREPCRIEDRVGFRFGQ